MIYLGVDPGASGAIATIDHDVIETCVLNPKKNTERDIADFLNGYRYSKCFAILEQVNAMPKQGVVSMFKFGQSFGFLRGLLIAMGIPFEMVRPAKWQGYMKCRTGGDKNITKAKASELFPSLKITHDIADAVLLAEYCRRTTLVDGSLVHEEQEASDG